MLATACTAFDDFASAERAVDTVLAGVVLIFDTWRPELSESERVAVATMFEGLVIMANRFAPVDGSKAG